MTKKNDQERESKTILELRKKNKKLTLELNQLRKRIRHLDEILDDDPFGCPEEQEYKPAKKIDEETLKCPKCGAYTKNVFTILSVEYYKCESCGSKGRKPVRQ